MRVVSLNVDRSRERETMGGLAGRTSVVAEVTIKFVPETAEETNWLNDPMESAFDLRGYVRELIAKTPELEAEAGPTRSSSPFIVVSVRPQIDGAPSMSMVLHPQGTEVLPLQVQAIAPDGQLVRLDIPLEIRASAR